MAVDEVGVDKVGETRILSMVSHLAVVVRVQCTYTLYLVVKCCGFAY